MIPPTQANGTFMKMMSGGPTRRKAAKSTARISTSDHRNDDSEPA